MTNLILWLSICWLAPLICFMNINESKFKKNIVVGVTFPFAARNHPDVQAQLKRFKTEQIVICAVLCLLAVAGIFVKPFDLSMNLWYVWIELMILLPLISYFRCNKALKNVKETHSWKQQNTEKLVVDLSSVKESKWLSPWIFVPAVVLSLIPVLWTPDFSAFYFLNAACIILYWLLYRYAYRNKAERVDNNLSVTLVLTQVRRYNWGKIWLIIAYASALFSWCMALSGYSEISAITILIAICVLLTAASLHVELSTRRVQEKLTANSGTDYYVDEDDQWIGGMFYYNPNDTRTVVNCRVGTNSSVNLARPMGKFLIVLTIAFLLILPFTNLFFDTGKNFTLAVQDDGTEIVVTAGKQEYELDKSSIQNVTLLEDLPQMTRTFGTGLPNLLKGTFKIKDYGKSTVYLDPTCPPFILVETENELYLFGSRSTETTQAMYDLLKN